MLQLYPSASAGRPFVGVAGWAYPHWHRLLGIEEAAREHAVLARLGEMFDLIEITSAYYHPPEVKTVKAWLAAAPRLRPFYFTLRLWNKLVRERALLLQNDIRLMKAALTPLHEAGKLGALLVPVLPAMHYSQSNELWLLSLVDAFAEFPLFVENLHVSWAKSDTVLRLQDRGIGLVVREHAEAKSRILQPPSQRMAYLRYEGQELNAAQELQTARDAQRNSLYTEADIASMALKIKNLLPALTACFIVFHNHENGNSLTNALQLQNALLGAPMNPPPRLLQSFPPLQKIAANTHQQRDLFEESI